MKVVQSRIGNRNDKITMRYMTASVMQQKHASSILDPPQPQQDTESIPASTMDIDEPQRKKMKDTQSICDKSEPGEKAEKENAFQKLLCGQAGASVFYNCTFKF